MPSLSYGKYADAPVSTVPDDYLVWVATRKNHKDKAIALQELKERGKEYMLPSQIKTFKGNGAV